MTCRTFERAGGMWGLKRGGGQRPLITTCRHVHSHGLRLHNPVTSDSAWESDKNKNTPIYTIWFIYIPMGVVLRIDFSKHNNFTLLYYIIWEYYNIADKFMLYVREKQLSKEKIFHWDLSTIVQYFSNFYAHDPPNPF